MKLALDLRAGLVLLAACGAASAAGLPSHAPLQMPKPALQASAEREAKRKLNRTSLYFEPNVGQADAAVRYVVRGGGFSTLLTGNEALFLNSNTRQPFRLQFLGATGRGRAVAAEPLIGISNYFIGNDPSNWHTDIPHYSKLRFENVYENIDAVFYSQEGRLEYDFVVKPGGDPSRIELAWQGVDRVVLEKNGDMVVSTSAGDLRHKRPSVYQLVGGRRVPVQASYVARGGNRFAIHLGDSYNRNYALIIDPTLYYSTYIGGTAADDISAVATDALGTTFFTGTTTSVNFPVFNAYQATAQNNGDAFIMRLGANGGDLLYSTYIGGEGPDHAYAIALDAAGYAFITGYTNSFSFPVTTRAFDNNFNGVQDVFVLKLGLNGNSIVYSTYVGAGDTYSLGSGIAVDLNDNAYVCGTTSSSGFPTTAGVFSTSFKAGADGFVLKLDANGANLLFSTLFGGSFDDTPTAIAVDPAGNVYLAGTTASQDFPTTAGAYSRTNAGLSDAFVLKFSLDGKRLLFSTFLGSASNDTANAMAIEPGGRIVIAGQAGGSDFPTTFQASKTTVGGSADAFVARFNSDASMLIASTLVGSNAYDVATGVLVQEGGFIAMGGYTESNNYPVTSDAFEFSENASGDALLVTIQPLANKIQFATILGGSGTDVGRALARTPEQDVVIAGSTGSTNFPTTSNVLSSNFVGGGDSFSTRISGLLPLECRTTVSPVGTSYNQPQGSGGIAISDGCAWNAFPTVPWISFANPSDRFGTGAGSLNYNVAANPGAEPRMGAVYAAGNLVPIVQKGTANTATFTDVPVTDSFADFIRIIKNQGVTTGCGANVFCPNDNVTRWQMAVFLVRGMIGSDDFPYPLTPYFTDVPSSHPEFKWIQKLRELKITTGCTTTTYCPNDPVSRGQMAVFLIRARYGDNFFYPLSGYFTDVTSLNTFFQYVQKLKQIGITAGCTSTTFCVDGNITRGQMAVFLTRGFFTPW